MKKFLFTVFLMSIGVIGFVNFSKPVKASMVVEVPETDFTITFGSIIYQQSTTTDFTLFFGIPLHDTTTNSIYDIVNDYNVMFGGNGLSIYTVEQPVNITYDYELRDNAFNIIEIMPQFDTIIFSSDYVNGFNILFNGVVVNTYNVVVSNIKYITLRYKDFISGSYDDGYIDGKIDGYYDGYDVGKKDGYDFGYSVGLYESFDYGYSVGVDDGFSNGYRYGRDEGYDEGYFLGYDYGHDDGYAKGTQDSGTLKAQIINFLPGVLGAIFMFFFQIGQIGILGITILDILGMVVLVGGLIFLIKFFF